jgi:MoxR-like ATPase
MKNLETLFDICQDADISVLVKGVHGIGKSERAEAYARNKNYHSEVLFLSHQETGDLIGIPYLEDGATNWSTPIWLQ